MKKINTYLSIAVLFFSIQVTSIMAMEEQAQPTREKVTQSANSWFSYFTAPLVSFANSIANTFSAIKNYFFPVAIQQSEEQSVNANEPQLKEKEAIQPEANKNPIVRQEPQPIINKLAEPQEKALQEVILPSPLQQQTEEIVNPQLPILGVSYNCAQKVLGLTFENIHPRYFQSVDTYQYSPQKKYILATTIDKSVSQLIFNGMLTKGSTKLINPSSNKIEITTLNNIKMHAFSPQETKLLFLTSDTSLWATFGITKPSKKHKERTGTLKKTSDIFTYHIFDITQLKIINSFENAISVLFNNDDEITVYFEDGAIEVHKLYTSPFGPRTKKSSEIYKYFPHTNELILTMIEPVKNFSSVNAFYFSPQKKYLLIEKTPDFISQAMNTVKEINKNLPLIELIKVQTGETITNFGTLNMLMNDTRNIITYEFSPEETKILLQTHGQYGCKYILFDIEQNSIIDQSLASAQSVRFKNEHEFTIIDAQGKTQDILINVVQQTVIEKLSQQFSDVVGAENIKKLQDFTTQIASGFTELQKRTASKKGTIVPLSEIKQDLQEFLNSLPKQNEDEKDLQEFFDNLPEENKDDDEMLFDSVVEQSMYIFKKHATKDKQKAQNAIADIISELSTNEEEEGDIDKQSIVIETYKSYSPNLQKQFVTDLLEHYKICTQEIKEKFITTLFAAPHGNVYNPRDKEKNKIKNEQNTVTATIKNDKIGNQNQDVLIFTSNDPIALLSTHILEKSIRTMLFNPSGTILAVSYEKQPTDIAAPLDIFMQNKNQQYKSKDFSINNSPEIIGLLFLDESTLLLLDEQYTITSMAISDNTKKFQQALALLKKIETDCLDMANADINSPAIFTDTFEDLLRLEYISGKLSNEHKAIINKKQAQLEDTYKLTITGAIKDILTKSWNSHKDTIKTIGMNLVKPTLSIAIFHLLQAATGNTPLNIEALKIPIMSAIAATFAIEYGKYILNPSLVSAITGGWSAAITEQFIPYNKTVTVSTLKTTGVLRGAFTASIAAEIQLIITQEGGVEKLIQEYSRDFLLREKKPSSESEKEVTSVLFSTIKSTLHNEQVASLLAEVTYVTIESACIGMGLYFAGLGFAHEKPLTEALYCNALRGVVQGTINYGFTATSNKTGAIITIPTAMISASMVSDLTHTAFTTESAASALIHATTQAVADVIINDTERLTRILSQTKENIEQSIRDSWSRAYDLFSTFKENAFTVQDIEERDEPAYGSV